MSVINKMLRDLDARRADGAGPDPSRPSGSSAMQGTASVPVAVARQVARWRLGLLLVLLLTLGGVAAWYQGMFVMFMDEPAVVVIEPSAPAPVPTVSVPEPALPPAVATTAAAAVAARPQAAAVAPAPREQSEQGRTEAGRVQPPGPMPAEKRPALDQRNAPAPPPAVMPAPSQPPAAAAAPLPAATATAAPVSTVPPLRRQTIAEETLAQAQALWNAGSREAALDLLREAVAAVERIQPVDVAMLAPLVREQVRMELAQGRPDVVLGVLSRLEPMLSGQAELWAVRGNAAQRLGRHQEAVQAYQMALQLRPGEQRWLLGAAVSLAALGQLEAAAQQAEQARALGPVSPEVLHYLRQAGVPQR